MVELGWPVCTCITPELIQQLHGENAWSIPNLCAVLKLRQQIADERLAPFLQSHPAAVQPLLTTSADKTVAWQWILKYAILADIYPKETYSLLMIDHPVSE